MCCSYHTPKSVYRYISLFFVTMLLLARLSFVANSPLNAVFTFTLLCLSTASRTRSRATFPASSKNRRDSMWLEFITAPVNILSNAASISHQTRDRSLLLAYSPPMCMKHRSNCDFAPASRDPRHRGLSVFNGEARTLDTTKFFELFDALVASLQSRKTLHQSSDLAALF